MFVPILRKNKLDFLDTLPVAFIFATLELIFIIQANAITMEEEK
jgi:hypothetical protein